MVMRRVFNHHVCLCVLSTAILAGLALMTSQTKVYAQAKNCNGVVNGGGEDDKSGLIMCDGGPEGSGRDGVLEGNRTIDMNVHPGVAVTITGKNTKITIKSELTVKDSKGSRSSNDNPAIKVDGGGELTVMNANVTGVKKGMEVSGLSSSVTVLQGTIGVRNGGGPVIEVSNNGEVTLMKGVTVTESGGSEGEVVIENGGTVQLNGQSFSNVAMGIVVKGGGKADVKGGGATITVRQNGTGFKMEGSGTANVMDMTINGSGGGGNRTGVEMGSTGTLTMTKVTLEQLETGAKVTKGTLELNGGSTINVKQGGTGLNVTGSGTVKLEGTEIQVGAGATGVEVLSGTANVVSTTITLQGDGSKGLVMKGGTATVMGATITVGQNGTGLVMSGGKVTMMSGEIRGSGGGTETGLSMTGRANVTLMGGRRLMLNRVGRE
ncbi:hypothetical protein [Bartonella schoenbuchensis]|uniref:hypothetical protein n=1 Tax=Bartonella schoenbuchensis TaxID=165694 RepID=UPI0031454EF3